MMASCKRNIVIVDDNLINCASLELSINTFISDLAEYEVIKVFGGIKAFGQAKKYITHNQQEIDILLVDYRLNGNYGTELFKVINNSKYNIYKILHSEWDTSLVSTKDDLQSNKYHDFCQSKGLTHIQKAIKKFETEVLEVKLFGNKNFREKHTNNKDADRKCAGDSISFYDIVYAETVGKGEEVLKIVYVHDYKLDEYTTKVKELAIKALCKTNLFFRRLNSHFVVNLLWVADVEKYFDSALGEEKVRIKFITPDNLVCHKESHITSLFQKEVLPNISKIGIKTPSGIKTPYFLT